MYIKGEKERHVSFDDYEGTLYTEYKLEMLGPGFSGQRFDAELETTSGKANLRFLVNEQTHDQGAYYSPN